MGVHTCNGNARTKATVKDQRLQLGHPGDLVRSLGQAQRNGALGFRDSLRKVLARVVKVKKRVERATLSAKEWEQCGGITLLWAAWGTTKDFTKTVVDMMSHNGKQHEAIYGRFVLRQNLR